MASVKIIIRSNDLGKQKEKDKNGKTLRDKNGKIKYKYNEALRNKPALLFALYTHNSDTILISVNKKVEPKFWDEEQAKVIRHKEASTINDYLDSVKSKIYRIVDTLRTKEIEPFPKRVKEEYLESLKSNLPEAELTKSILFQWRDLLESKKNTLKARTITNQKNSIEALEGWLKSESLEGLRPDQFTLKHLTKWKDHLNKDHASNTVAKRLKHFKAFLKYFVELGGQTSLNLSQIKYKETEGVKIYLTEEELEIFKTVNLDGINSFKVERPNKTETIYASLDAIRDLFVLQCNTGLRISDLKRLDKNIKGNKIAIENKKTGKKVEIPISPTIRQLLEKYKYTLPQIAEQKINDGIKQVYKICFPKNKIQIRSGEKFKSISTWTLISSHDAIRTFITLSAERGMSVSAISTITGKTIPVLLKHYLNQSQKFAEQEMEKAWGFSPLRIAN